MPNWVKHYVEISGPVVEKAQMLSFVENGKELFDFNKIIPMPKDLQITAGCYEYVAHSRSFCFDEKFFNKQKRIMDTTNKYLSLPTQKEFVSKVLETHGREITLCLGTLYENHTMTQKEVENILKGYWNYNKYGYVNWYDWSLSNWGTKWNACDTEYDFVNDIAIFTFDTAWSTCDPVFKKLSELFPNLLFEITFCDEDMHGGNSGCYSYKNGECSIIDKALSDIIYDTWGEDCVDFDENDDSSDAKYEGEK